MLLCLHTVLGAAVPPDAVTNTECSALVSSELRDEIASYQPIVDQIIAAVVDGPYSGSTWNRFVLYSRSSRERDSIMGFQFFHSQFGRIH